MENRRNGITRRELFNLIPPVGAVGLLLTACGGDGQNGTPVNTSNYDINGKGEVGDEGAVQFGGGVLSYVVQPGDNLTIIAEMCGTGMNGKQLFEFNLSLLRESNPEAQFSEIIQPGQTISVPNFNPNEPLTQACNDHIVR